jgi:hypothetical protein
MTKVIVAVKDLKKVLKTFSTFQDQSQVTQSAVTLSVKPEFKLSIQNDYLLSEAKIPATIVESGDDFTMTPELLMDLSISGAPMAELSWKDAKSPLNLVCGKLTTSLRVATTKPNVPTDFSDPDTLVTIPLGMLATMTNCLRVPYAYYKAKRDKAPFWLRVNKQTGCLEAMADDSYSLAKIETTLAVNNPEFEVKIPFFIMDTLFGKIGRDDEGLVTLGSKGYTLLLTNGEVVVKTQGLNENSVDFDSVFKEQKEWYPSCDFVPSVLHESVKSVCSIIPTKDKSGVYIRANFAMPGDKAPSLSLSVSHADVGEANYQDIDGISNMYIEKGVNSFIANMHPQAFLEYTNLLETDMARMICNRGAVYYESSFQQKSGNYKIRYLFPTVAT